MKPSTIVKRIEKDLQALKESCMSGDSPIHEAYAKVKVAKLQDQLKEVLYEIEEAAMEELKGRYFDGNAKSYTSGGLEYTIRNGSTRYSFSKIPEVKDFREQLKSIEKKYKTAFLMKQQGKTLFDNETGEEIDVSDVGVTYTKDSLVISKAK